MSRLPRLLLVAGALSAMLACATSASEPAPSASAPVRRGAPRRMDAASVALWLASPADRIRVVSFWASWCQPCLHEMPVLRDLALRHPDVDVVLVNVDHPSVQQGRVGPLVESLGVAHLDQILLDATDPNAALRANVPGWPQAIPWTLVIRPDGTVARSFVESASGPRLEGAVQELRGPLPTPTR